MPPTVAGDGGPTLVHVGRQPIYDRSGRLAAYELLFRDAADATGATAHDAQATSRVIVSAFTDFGLDQLSGSRSCFINVTREFLIGDLPLPFTAGQAVLEVIETVEVDDRVERGVAALIARGFPIALDDFVWGTSAERLLGRASYVKIDVLGVPPEQIRDTVRRLRQWPKLRLVAERVEEQAQLRAAYELGFDYFQGYLLGRPHVLSRTALSPARASRLRLIVALSARDIDFDEVVALIMADPALSYRLLRATNATAGPASPVASVRDAAVLLGLDMVRQWVVLMLFSDITDATEEQLAATMTRARFCQLLAGRLGLAAETAFTVGLLSSVADLLAQPSAELAAGLPVAEEVEAALTTGAGAYGRVLAAVLAYERQRLLEAADLVGLSEPETLTRTYLSAVGWTTGMVDGLLPTA